MEWRRLQAESSQNVQTSCCSASERQTGYKSKLITVEMGSSGHSHITGFKILQDKLKNYKTNSRSYKINSRNYKINSKKLQDKLKKLQDKLKKLQDKLKKLQDKQPDQKDTKDLMIASTTLAIQGSLKIWKTYQNT